MTSRELGANRGEENLGPSCAESFRAQKIQVYIYPKAATSAGSGLDFLFISKHPD